ncbi:MAG: hypothetical protein OZ921_15290 [Sorangiineae bacterium]|nr:hypothetical protein [Polyangiaceae bacterium]MEB2323875.1 hypothetical protein [Sorangiineae bacterium]
MQRLDAATARRFAVLCDADERTVKKVWDALASGEQIRGAIRQRILRTLIAHGFVTSATSVPEVDLARR